MVAAIAGAGDAGRLGTGHRVSDILEVTVWKVRQGRGRRVALVFEDDQWRYWTEGVHGELACGVYGHFGVCVELESVLRIITRGWGQKLCHSRLRHLDAGAENMKHVIAK